jgi:hypothetical protein
MSKKAAKSSSRYRMSKLQKFFIEHNMDIEPNKLAIELGIPADVIERYIKKVAREIKKADEEEAQGKPRTTDQFMIKNKRYGVTVMTKEASQIGDANKGAGLKSKYYTNVIQKIREE